MPYKSEAQRGKFHAMLARGEISKKTVDEWDKASKGLTLPQKVSRTRREIRRMGRARRKRARGR